MRKKKNRACFNRYWNTRTWDDGITDELDITDDRKKEIRQAISTAKQKTNESDNEDIAVDCGGYSNEDADTTDTDNDALVEAVSALLVAVSAYGIYKAAPYIKRWWTDQAVPSLIEYNFFLKISGEYFLTKIPPLFWYYKSVSVKHRIFDVEHLHLFFTMRE